MLTHWARDRARGPKVPLEMLVKRQTSETADFFGLADRGRLAPGLRADVNVIDFDGLQVQKPEIVHDMPANGRRFVQRVDGYQATICAGQPIFERGEHTGALPGKLVRAGQDATAHAGRSGVVHRSHLAGRVGASVAPAELDPLTRRGFARSTSPRTEE